MVKELPGVQPDPEAPLDPGSGGRGPKVGVPTTYTAPAVVVVVAAAVVVVAVVVDVAEVVDVEVVVTVAVVETAFVVDGVVVVADPVVLHAVRSALARRIAVENLVIVDSVPGRSRFPK